MNNSVTDNNVALSRLVASAIFELEGSPACLEAANAIRAGFDRKAMQLISGLPGPGECGFGMNQYLATSVLSKSDFLDLHIDRKAAAISRFHVAENLCQETNFRLSRIRDTTKICGLGARQIQYLVSRKIAGILGDFSWDEVVRRTGFGPGSCVGLPRRKATNKNKWGCLEPTVTKGCLVSVEPLYKWLDLWGSYQVSGNGAPCVVPGNKIVTVPKSSKTERVIAVEPLINGFIQKGLGRCIRSRLMKRGVNLLDQTINQHYAREGSLHGVLATLDLEMASDTLAYNTRGGR